MFDALNQSVGGAAWGPPRTRRTVRQPRGPLLPITARPFGGGARTDLELGGRRVQGPPLKTRHLPLEELRPRGQARADDACCHRVLAPLLFARAPQRVRAHPSLRVSGEPLACLALGAVPATARVQLPYARRNRGLPNFLREFYSLALPALRCGHDCDAEIYRRGVIPMRFLRYFVALSSTAF